MLDYSECSLFVILYNERLPQLRRRVVLRLNLPYPFLHFLHFVETLLLLQLVNTFKSCLSLATIVETLLLLQLVNTFKSCLSLATIKISVIFEFQVVNVSCVFQHFSHFSCFFRKIFYIFSCLFRVLILSFY